MWLYLKVIGSGLKQTNKQTKNGEEEDKEFETNPVFKE